MATVGVESRFDAGRMIRRGFSVIQRAPVAMAAVSVLFFGLPAAAAGWMQIRWLAKTPPVGDFGATFARLGIAQGISILTALVLFIGHGAVAAIASDALSGRPVEPARMAALVLRSTPRLALLGLVTVVATIIGYFLLVVPGVLLALAWSVAAPVAVLEPKGIAATLSRSANLTRSHRGIIFGLYLAYAIPAVMITYGARFAVGAPLTGPGAFLPAATLVMQPILSILSGAVISAMTASLYFELREIKEGVGIQGVAAVFD